MDAVLAELLKMITVLLNKGKCQECHVSLDSGFALSLLFDTSLHTFTHPCVRYLFYVGSYIFAT